jgi:hypothetical protein
MLYENLNADHQYPNFADTIFSRKQFVGKYCYAATNTYGYPTEGIAVKQEDTLTDEEEEKIVNGNAILISITDCTIGYKARLNLCCSEAIAAKKAGKSVEKYQLKKEANLKRKATISTEVKHNESEEDLRADDTKKNLLQMPNLISHIISIKMLAMVKSHHIKNVKKYLSSALAGSSVVGKY